MIKQIRISRELLEESPGPNICVSRAQDYVGEGLKRIETRSVTSESDFSNELYEHYSEDNGRTWGEWQDRYAEAIRSRGNLEMSWRVPRTGVYNAVHGHYVALNMQRIFLENHHDAYKRFRGEAAASFSDHSFLYEGTRTRSLRPILSLRDFTAEQSTKAGQLHNL